MSSIQRIASNEETPLLGVSSSLPSSPVPPSSTYAKASGRATPLPKLQIFIVLLFQISEPMSSNVIYPFINQLIWELDVTHGDVRKIGYYAGTIESLFFATEALTIMFWGRLSDRIGRKPVLLIGLIGVTISMVLFGLSRTFWALVASRCLCGLLNGNVGVIKSVTAEIADESNMAQAFSLLAIGWAAGATIAPLIGGSLVHPYERFPEVFVNTFWKRYPYFLPCFVAAVYCAIVFLFTLFYLKETADLSRLTTAQSPNPQYLREIDESPPFSTNNTAFEARDSKHAILTDRVLLAISAYASLAVIDISFAALQPLMYATPIHSGGLGLSATRIGLVSCAYGIVNGFYQAIVFPPTVLAIGPRKTMLIGMSLFVPIYVMFPILNWVAQKHGVGLMVWALIGLQVLMVIVMDMSYACIFMYVASASSSKQRGSVNGLAQVVASIVRAIGPGVTSSMFALSQTHNLLGGNLVYAILMILSAAGVCVTSRLPADIWKVDS